MIKSKIKSTRKIKKKLADCRLKTAYLSFLLMILILLLSSTTELHPTIRYVSSTGSNIPPYLTWENAANSIQDCINISEFGDTIYVANGVYEEQVVMINGLSLIGAGTDSCIIDTRALITSQNYISVEVADSCLIKGFYILCSTDFNYGYGIYSEAHSGLITSNKFSNANTGIIISDSDIKIYKNFCFNVRRGINAFNSNSIIRKNDIITNSEEGPGGGISIGAFNSNYMPIIDSNYIETINRGISKSFGSRPTITNNEIVLNYAPWAIFLSISDSAKVFNNLIYSEESGGEGIRNNGVQHLELYNNYITNIHNWAISVGGDNIVKNNVVTNSLRGIRADTTQNLVFQYNNVWNNDENYLAISPDSTNLSADPMIVNDDTTQGELDFHLQAFSPMIDAGDPNILDRDGSRSDIGLYGGPYGWIYTYQDLSPRPPHNLTAVYEEGLVKLTWNKNTEADFSHYRIYRDTISILIYDSTRIVGETIDSVFFDDLPITNKAQSFYYLVTAFDNQNNQSAPSEEITVVVTGLTEHPPIGYDDYRLLSNYPNPFNPSTIIPYRLKEGGYVKLYIYDIKGELVRILVNQWQEKGYYEVVFHPNTVERSKASKLEVMMGPKYSDMSSGVYIYQIMVRGEGDIPVFSDIGKMILMK